MTRRSVCFSAGLALACLLALPTAARAQSSIAGTVKDTSGAVLPGVTVEVSSEALIEKTKAATTDGGGQYRFVDLRPGMYSVKFSLTGFQTVERAGFQLLSDFNARIDADMKVGAMAETITVTGAAPIVDISSASKVAVLDRQAIDNIPTARTMQGIGQLILGVSLNAPDVGGSAGAMQTYMSMRGGAVSAANNTVMVDGMVINSMILDGASQVYTNDANVQEMTYQTAGVDAERSGGGITLNMVPKEGGNRFSGSGSGIFRPGAWQGDNYSERFKTWGLPVDKNGQPAINRVERISDLNISEGGPIARDKLWFFTSARDFQPINTVPNVFLDDGAQGIDDNYIRNAQVRLTYQVSPRHKLSSYYERVFKWRGHDMTSTGNSDPETSALVWNSPNYSSGAVKYTGTMSARFLIEGGYSQNNNSYNLLMQPGIQKERGTAEWFASPARSATGLGTQDAAPPLNPILLIGGAGRSHTSVRVLQGSVSYVTGTHHAKGGVQWKRGKFLGAGDGNADLTQVYPNATRAELNRNLIFPSVPLLGAASPCSGINPATGAAQASTCSVTIYNTPRIKQESMNYDFGAFIQDSFTLKRLTVNAGVRWESLNSQIDAMTALAGRFVPERHLDDRKDLPDWKDWAPRLQVVYDLFGNSKTAIKYSFNRYNEAQTVSVASALNGLGGVTSSRNWTDLNGDDIAQGARTWNADGTAFTDCQYLTPGCEINLSGATGVTQTALSPTFGLVGDPGAYIPFPRRYRLEQGIEIQHALLPRVSATGTYYHGNNKNLTKTVNRGRSDDGTKGTQYQPVNLFNPIDGTPYLYYTTIVTIPTDNVTYLEPLRKSIYDNYTAELQLRPYAGAQLSGGIELARNLSKNCGTSAFMADGVTQAIVDPNEARFCDEWNLVAYPGGPVLEKPFNKNFKLSGVFPTVYGINLGVSYQNIDSGGLSPTFRYGANFKYPDGTMTYNMLGKSTAVPACPTTFGCVPGGVTSANLSGGAGGTSIGSQFPTGYIADERIVQLDLKASKNFRVGRVSIQPVVESFNLLNIDQVRGRQSSEVAAAAGTYMQPSTMLQGRIIGFGANLKW